MSTNLIDCFEGCYIMQREDIDRFADTLSDGFSQYRLFEYVCNDKYDHAKMKLFWRVSISLIADNAICIADSKQANSVLIYIRPKSKEPSIWAYLKGGGLKLMGKLGVRSAIRLLRFDLQAQRIAQRHRCDRGEDGYLMAFATRLDKQGQGYGKPLIEALLRYLDATGEGCYLETLKAENVGLYEHFSFQLKEQCSASADIPLFAMYRPQKSEKK
ncbi:MAG: GNAT family N-acetyltransferase [Alistipes sp.]|nr:GNAT family N-acetyltransferase [Alistipes sp.]